jgi:hypothetical protein
MMIVANLIEGPSPDAPDRPRQNAGLFGEDDELEELQEARERRTWVLDLLEGRRPLVAQARVWAKKLLGG